jgi:GTP:adenosylcobinamide-phosphate guanylyltransferase
VADFAGLVLAGRRDGADPLAESTGASHRALVPVAGTPMLLRVLDTLRASGRAAPVTVSIDAPGLLDAVPQISRSRETGAILLHRSLGSVSASVVDALEQIGDAPVLATTADHALLTTEMLDYLCDAALGSDADLLVGMVSERVIRAAHPDTTRTYFRLRGDAWSGANLFVFRTPRARRAAAFWRSAERHRKRPWKLARAIGFGALLRFGLRRLDLDAALDQLSRTAGARVRAVSLPFAEAAIDVDRPSDLALATRILEARGDMRAIAR